MNMALGDTDLDEEQAPAGIYSEEAPDMERINHLVEELGEDALLPEELDAYLSQQAQPHSGTNNHYANLAEVLDETELGHIASDVIKWVLWDEQSRSDWEVRESKGIKLLGVSDKTEGGANFEGASRVVHPLLAEAVNQFHARAITEMWPAEGPVKTQVLGEITPDTNAQAERVQDYMNYLYTTQMPGAFEEEDQMLFRLPLSGSCFKKVYFDPLEDSIVSRFVEPSDFIVPFTATDLRTAPRYTHRLRQHQNDVKKLQASGYYSDTYLTKPSNETYDYPQVKTEIDRTEGRTNNMVTEDQRHTIYECYVDYDIEGFEDKDDEGEKTDIALPYIITVDRDNQRVLRIQRNWRPNDPIKRKRLYFTHYKFTPGFGFYGYGLLHLIGGLSNSATGALRALLDSAAFANMQGGYRSRDARLTGGDKPLAPGEWREVDSSAEELSKAFFKIPYEEPSPVLFQLLGYLDERGQRFVGTTENMVGEGNANAAVGTTLALIEQGSKQFTSIHMRLHLAHGNEYRITAELCAEYLPEEGYPYAVPGGQNQIMASDFDGRVDVIPVSDPNIISSTQRIAQAQAVLDLATKFPQKLNLTEAIKRMLTAMRVQNIDQLVIDDSQPDPMAMKMQQLQIAEQEAKVTKLQAEANNIDSKSTETSIKALYEAIQAAMAALQNPAIIPVADQISKSAGFKDKDGGSLAGDVQQGVPVQPVPTEPQTNPTLPPQPLAPEQGQPTMGQPMQQAPSPGLGVAGGIEKQGNQIEARATGGPVNQGQPYLVGENGPEIIVPEDNGTVIPNEYSAAITGTGYQGKDLIGHHLIRDDMTAKGQGFYGNINGSSDPEAPAVSEFSIGVGVPKNYQHIPGLNPRVAPLTLDGHQQYYDAPSIVPGLGADQLNEIRNGQVSDSVYDAAERAATDRQWAGKPVFAPPLEPVTPYPKGKNRRPRRK